MFKKLSIFFFIILLISPVQVFAETTEKNKMAQTLYEEGRKAFDDKDYKTALEKFNNSLALYREAGDRQSEADLLTWIAAINIELDNFNEASNLLKESQNIYEDFNTSPGEKASFKDINKAIEAIHLYIEGIEYIDAGNYKTALKKLNEVLLLVREMGKRQYEAEILSGIGGVYEKLDNYDKTTDYYKEALKFYFELNDDWGQIDLLSKLVEVYVKLGNTELSKKYYLQGIKNSRILGYKLQNKASNFHKAGEHHKALNALKLALMIFKKFGNDKEKAQITSDMGKVYSLLKEFQIAIDYYQIALEGFKKVEDKKSENMVLSELGIISLISKDHKNALMYFQESLELSKTLHDSKAQTTSLYYLGGLYNIEGKYTLAIEYYKKALEKYQEAGNTGAEANVYYMLGRIVSLSLNDCRKGKEYFTEFLSISEKLDLKMSGDVASAHQTLALCDSMLGNNKEGIRHSHESLKINQKLNRTKKVLNDLRSIGNHYAAMNNYPKALEYYQQALKIAKEKGYRDEEKGLLYMYNRFSMILSFYDADYQSPLESQWKVINAAKKEGDKKGEADGYWQLGKTYFNMGDYEKSLKYYKQALAMAEGLLGEQNIMYIYKQIGEVYSFQLDYPRALESYQKALIINKSIDKHSLINILDKGDIYAQIALMSSYIDNHSEAISNLQKALKIHKSKNAQKRLTKDYGIAGEIYRVLGDYPQAFDYWQQGLEIAKKTDNRFEEIEILKDMGGAYFRKKDHQNALSYYQQALEIAEKIHSEYEVNYILEFIGFLLESTGDIEKAIFHYKKLIKRFESTRSKLKLEEDRSSFFKNKLSVYKKLILILLKLGKEDEAFNYLERTKSRSLIELLGNRIKLQKGNDREYSEEERKLQFKIELLLYEIQRDQKKSDETDAIRKATLRMKIEELEKTRKKYANLLAKIKRENPELSSMISVDPLTLKEVQKILDASTTLLEYFVTEEKTLLWVIDKSDSKVIAIPIKATELFSKINDLIAKIKSLHMGYEKEAKELYKLLIRPAKPYIKTKRIGIVPHSLLHYLPFQTLINADNRSQFSDVRNKKAKNGTRFLIEEYDIFYTPSASVLRFVYEKRKKITGKILAFGNPDLGDEKLNLPYAEEEVIKIKENYPETAFYLKENATEKKVKKLSGDYNIIHFASHAELNPKSPLFSSIRLAKGEDEDGRLEVHEIFNLNLENTSLVVLSACSTGLGKLSTGDELIGLTRGFIYAGTPSIVASLWNVNDRSTSELMGLFYKNLKTHSKVEALRKAQIEMIRGEIGKGIVRGVGGITASKSGSTKTTEPITVNGSHPYFWAPFILLGDWK